MVDVLMFANRSPGTP